MREGADRRDRWEVTRCARSALDVFNCHASAAQSPRPRSVGLGMRGLVTSASPGKRRCRGSLGPAVPVRGTLERWKEGSCRHDVTEASDQLCGVPPRGSRVPDI